MRQPQLRTLLSEQSKYPALDYERFSIRLVDSTLDSNNSCSFPLNSTEESISDDLYRGYSDSNVPLAFIQRLKPVHSSRYVDVSFCSDRNNSSSVNSSKIYRYIVVGNELTLADLEVSCSVDTVIRSARSYPTVESSLTSIHEALVYGFELSWIYSLCSDCNGHGDCIIESNSVVCRPYTICYENVPLSELPFHCGILGLRFLFGFSCLIGLLVYKWRKSKNLSKYEDVGDIFEELKNFNHIPLRYSYSEIKKMTGNFKERLGTGGYGTVYKGKLRSGPQIAVKMMDKSMSSAQEFANLVTSMAKIQHDSLLQLIGFCLEGEKQAFLVYELMPNGSLHKYLNVSGSGEEEANPLLSLSYQKMHRICVEVARGIDHLHQNFGIQTSHLGFKPHNVLLDENLNPKISDFGLVKLYDPLSVGRSSMAPEFHYKNIGQVPHKADVYSYGILLMEMVGKMKMLLNERGKEVEITRNAAAAEEETKGGLKNTIIVALWCIQMLPEERPSMNEVVEMLQGDADLLKMPPNPFVDPKNVII